MRSFFITVVFLLGGVQTILAAFVSTPTSVNATLGSTATFSCNATDGAIGWIVDGLLLTELNAPDINTSNYGSAFFLHIPATEVYNNTNVTCAVAIFGGDDLYSDPVFLRVQGLLDAVSSLKTISLSQVICLTWDAPPSLDITGVDPDIWYCVDITVDNITLGNSSVNISKFNFRMGDYNDTNTSVIYKFRVTPINGAGDGPQSAPVTGYFSGPPRSITAENVVVETSADPLSVNFTITLGYIPPGELPNRFQVFAETVEDEDQVLYCTDDIPVTPDTNGRVLIQLNANTPTYAPGSSILKPYRKYSAMIVAKNDVGESRSTGDILFSTHEVQACVVNNCSKSGAISISCNFTENSNAKGYLSILCPKCNSSLSKDNSSQEMFIVASRNDTSISDLKISVSGLHPDNYTVFVFDIGENGLPPVLSGDTNYAAEEKIVTVTNPGEVGADDVVSVNGMLLEVPDTANSELKLCVSFESNTSSNSDGVVVFVHHIDNLKRLSAYILDETNCTTALASGNYSVGVFTWDGESTLNEPATPPTISVDIVPIISPVPSVPPTTAEIDPTSPSLFPVAITVPVAVVVLVAAVALIGTVVVFMKWNRANNECTVSPEEDPSESASPSSPSNHDIEKSGVHYAEVETVGGQQKPPLLDDSVQYQTVLPLAKHTNQTPPPVPAKRNVTIHPPSSRPCSVNLDNLIAALHTMASKWQQLGEALGMDEDLVDEIWTNNNGIDKECLKNFLYMWVEKSPSWSDVTSALNKIGEDELAGSLYVKYVLPGIVKTSPVYPAKLPLATDEAVGTAFVDSVPRVPSNPNNQPQTTLSQSDNDTIQDCLCNDSTPPVETAFQESPPHVNHLSPDKNCDEVYSQNGTITEVLEDAKEEGEEGNLSVNDDRHAYKGFNQSEKTKGSSAVLMTFSTLQCPHDASLGKIPLSGREEQYLTDQPPGVLYADVEKLSAKTTKPPSKVEPVQYSGVLPQKTETSTSFANKELVPPPLPAKTHRVRPLTSESLFDELHPTVTSQWQKLGKLLGMDEDRLDEIYTNNETDEECLRVMLQLWLQNPRANVTDALKTIGKNQLAESLCLKYKLPGEPTEEEGYESELPRSDEGGSRKPVRPENDQSQGFSEASSTFLANAEEPYDGDQVDGDNVEVPQEAIEIGSNLEALRFTTKPVEVIVLPKMKETPIGYIS